VIHPVFVYLRVYIYGGRYGNKLWF